MGLRLFIAILPNETVRRALAGCEESLKGAALRGSFTRPENLHLTLAFIGESDRAADVRRAMEKAVQTADSGRFTLSVGGPGRFRREGGDIFWVGVRENPALFRLQRSLSLVLGEAGFHLEGAQFTPHLTIARRVVMPSGFVPDQTVFYADHPLLLQVDSISLMRSERVDGRLTYTPVASLPLPGRDA